MIWGRKANGGTNGGSLAADRARMVKWQLRERGISDERVLQAMGEIRREDFMPSDLRHLAYEDGPQPIGFGQTISQPYIVALMTQAMELDPGDRVLEIGTGCGYQTAILSRLAREVCSVEFVPELADTASARLRELGCHNVRVLAGDGRLGWPEDGSFDAVIATCAAESVPPRLLDQLAEGGRMVIPVGPLGAQELRLLRRHPGGRIEDTFLSHVRFVPMVGEGL